jgi:hypothetical protein
MLFQSILQTCPWRRKSSPLKNEHVDPSWLENEQIKYLSHYHRFERSLMPWPLTGTSVPAAADCQLHIRSTAGIRENKASLADHGPPSLWVSQRCHLGRFGSEIFQLPAPTCVAFTGCDQKDSCCVTSTKILTSLSS